MTEQEKILNVYTERATVKRYSRKTKDDNKEFNQLNLGYTSLFEKGESVVVLRETDWFMISEHMNQIDEYINKSNDHQKQLQELQEEQKELRREVKKLNDDLKNELDLRSRIIFNYERVISDIQEKTLFKLFNMKLPNSYKLLTEFDNKGGKTNDKE